MNKVELIGNLARDPELRNGGQNQSSVCRFTVAVSDGYGEKEKTSFIPIVVFGRTAENCNKYLAKGKKVAVVGRIQTGSYTNKEGATVYTTDVIANEVEFLSPANNGGQNAQAKAPTGGNEDIPQGFNVAADDDIPF